MATLYIKSPMVLTALACSRTIKFLFHSFFCTITPLSCGSFYHGVHKTVNQPVVDGANPKQPTVARSHKRPIKENNPGHPVGYPFLMARNAYFDTGLCFETFGLSIVILSRFLYQTERIIHLDAVNVPERRNVQCSCAFNNT